MKTAIIFTLAILFLSFGKSSCFSQEEKDTLTILFVGNSYTYVGNLPQIVSAISDQTNTKIITKSSAFGGAKLREHWLGEKNLKTIDKIKNGDFDIVVLQEWSMGTINEPDSMIKYSSLLCEYIKEHNAKPYLFLTWAREKVPQYQETINKVYEKIATDNTATIVPVGKAWALAKHYRPNIELHKTDGSHPSDLGTFLTAYVFIATILHEIPDGQYAYYWSGDINGEPVELMYAIDPEDVIFCKKVAEEIVLK